MEKKLTKEEFMERYRQDLIRKQLKREKVIKGYFNYRKNNLYKILKDNQRDKRKCILEATV